VGSDAATSRATPPPSSKSAIFLSAAVFPGAGQLCQQRWLAGGGFGLAFLVSFLVFGVCAGRILIAYYSLMNSDAREPASVPLRPMVTALVIALGVYGANVLDVVVTHWRRRAGGRTSTPH